MCISPCVDPPTVTLSIEPRSVLEGERVTFTCQATANPPIMGYRSGWVFFKICVYRFLFTSGYEKLFDARPAVQIRCLKRICFLSSV